MNAGELQSTSLAEWCAIDVVELSRNIVPAVGLRAVEVELVQAVRSASDLPFAARIRRVGELLGQAARDARESKRVFEALATHRSDMVRCWAAYAVGADDRLTVPGRIEKLRCFALDDAGTVRECAWDAFRPHLARDVEGGLRALRPCVLDSEARVRRFAVEGSRPRGVWTRHIDELAKSPELGLPLLEPVRADDSEYVQTATANWLNDASKTRGDWVREVCARWLVESPTEPTRRIVHHATRTLRRAGDLT